MQRKLQKRRLVLAFLATTMWWACTESDLGGASGDTFAPTVGLALSDTLIDINQGLQFVVAATDNISLLTVGWSVTGAVTRDTTITFTTTTPSYAELFTINEGFTGGTFTVQAFATDGSGNSSDTVTATASVFDDQPPAQNIINPLADDRFAAGDVIPVVVMVTDPSGVARVIATLFSLDQFGRPVDLAADTLDLVAPFSTLFEDTLLVTVPASLAPGTYRLGTFAVDGATPQRSP